jgi:hypothetical protein
MTKCPTLEMFSPRAYATNGLILNIGTCHLFGIYVLLVGTLNKVQLNTES